MSTPDYRTFDERRKQAEDRLAQRLQASTSMAASDAARRDYRDALKRLDEEEHFASLFGISVPERTAALR